jgi:hypothetical protein
MVYVRSCRMNDWIVVAYYTKGTLYEQEVEKLRTSFINLNIPHYIEGIENQGSWALNTSYKPVFLQKMMIEFAHYTSIIYVDCDAEFLKFPHLFNEWVQDSSVHVGAYVFDRSCYSKSHHGFEMLSGTLYLQNSLYTKQIIDEWVRACQIAPNIWDQKHLERILEGKPFTKLPGEYCKIFDRPEYAPDPVIVHYQASRRAKRLERGL